MDVGKLPNHVNIVSLTCVFSICFVSHRLEFLIKFPTRDSLTRRPPEDMRQLMRRVEEYKRLEDDWH